MTQTTFSQSRLEVAFQKYDKENPEIYEMFQRFTYQAIQSRRSHIGAKLIMERIRWQTTVVANGRKTFKINNNYSAYYARKFEFDHPQHEGLFEKRRMKGDSWGV